MSQPTPLHNAAARAGAVFTDEGGWTVPAHFGDPLREYEQARTGCVVFDQSHRGKLELAGRRGRALPAQPDHAGRAEPAARRGPRGVRADRQGPRRGVFPGLPPEDAARRIALLAQPAAGDGRADAPAPRPPSHQRTGGFPGPHATTWLPAARRGTAGGGRAGGHGRGRPAAVEGDEGPAILRRAADAFRDLSSRHNRPSGFRRVLPDGRPDGSGMGVADAGRRYVARGAVASAGASGAPSRPAARLSRYCGSKRGRRRSGRTSTRTRSRRRSAGRRRRSATRRDVISARSRSSWPATAARSTARCSACG